MQARYDPRQKHDPRRVDAPAIEPRQALDNGFAQLFRCGGVAEHAVLDPLLKSFKHARWSAKVAVGDPQRNHVAPGIALPASAPGAGALERRVEIEIHLPVIAKKSRARSPASLCCVTLFLLLLLLLFVLLLPTLQRIFLQAVHAVVDFLGLHRRLLGPQMLGERSSDGRDEHDYDDRNT